MTKLVPFFLTIYLIAFLGFWLGGLLYGALFRRPAVYFPAGLAAKMAIAGLAGSLLAGIGGVVLATVIMDRAFSKRADYKAVPVRVAAVFLSALVLVGTFIATYALAWSVFE